MQVWTEIRRKVLVEKVPKRQICRDYNIFHTLAKMPVRKPRNTQSEPVASLRFVGQVPENSAASSWPECPARADVRHSALRGGASVDRGARAARAWT
jgi:hypothetical protein